MPSPASLRNPPERVFENYILTKEIGISSGLCKVNKDSFSRIPGQVGEPGYDNLVSSVLDIGFNFNFNNIRYTQFVVSTSGWIALIDPTTGTFNLSDILSPMSQTYENYELLSTFSSSHVVIAPWFDWLVNVGLLDYYTPSYQELVNKGLTQVSNTYHTNENGIFYLLDDSSNSGNRLIIRWYSLISGTPNLIHFECVLYENGKIEFRYDNRKSLNVGSGGSSSATTGIFFAGTTRIRDFSPLFGYRVSDRPTLMYGGVGYDASYTDTSGFNTANYTISLDAELHWPGQKTFGSIFTFQPPLNRRRVLPRQTIRDKDSAIVLPTVARTGDVRTGNHNSNFDDRSSVIYGRKISRHGELLDREVVNYPTTLPRFFGNSSEGISDRQNLFSQDFLVTGSVVKSLVQDYICNKPNSSIQPFNENKLFENDPAAINDEFFLKGTSVNDVGRGFEQPLKSKTQIKLSMKVDFKTTLFGASSSIYYYNSSTKRWQYPTASFNNGGFDVANPYSDVYRKRLVEVDRGFNAFGFNICSGSNNTIKRAAGYPTDDIFNQGWNRSNEITAINRSYSKSVQNDERYSANQNESFTIPISQPFLLEKAVIEFPFEAGPGWFADKTQCFLPVAQHFDMSYTPAAQTNVFDIGGPGLTVALFNQINIGNGRTRRDLVLSGTVTHEFDDKTRIVYSRSPDLSSPGGDVWQIIPQGFNAYGTPSTVVSGSDQGSGYFFTGSALLKCQSAISNGVLVRDTIYINQTSYLEYLTGSLEAVFNKQEWSLSGRGPIELFNQDPGGNGYRNRTIVAVNNLGRGGTGFEPSGRSIFCKEYVTSQGLSSKSYKNVFYTFKDDNTLSDLVNLATTSSPTPEFYATSVVSQQKTLASPYMLFPNDRLVLSISKARPYFFSTEVGSPYTTGSIEHDIKLTTGSINITLYGSLVSNGVEYHDTLNQPLSSNAVHEVVIGETKTW